MRDIFIPNAVTIFGTVKNKVANENATTIVLDSNGAYPRIVVFKSARKFADRINEGGFVKAECTVQEVKGPKRVLGPRTIACNRITAVNKRNEFAKFSIFGRPISVERVNNEEAFAIVKCVSANGTANYLRLNFYGTETEVDEFAKIGPENYINFKGDIRTSSLRTNYRDELVIDTFKNVKRK